MDITLFPVSQDVSHMILTIISIVSVIAAFVVPAVLALRHGVDTRTDAWSGNLISAESATPILGSRR